MEKVDTLKWEDIFTLRGQQNNVISLKENLMDYILIKSTIISNL